MNTSLAHHISSTPAGGLAKSKTYHYAYLKIMNILLLLVPSLEVLNKRKIWSLNVLRL